VRDPAEARRMTLGKPYRRDTNERGPWPRSDRAARAKPVMEGKAVLFKNSPGIDCFDIEVDERDPDKLVEIIGGLEPPFGGINLEGIKAPECFLVERKLRERMKIPVSTTISTAPRSTVGAAVLNGLRVVGKASLK